MPKYKSSFSHPYYFPDDLRTFRKLYFFVFVCVFIVFSVVSSFPRALAKSLSRPGFSVNPAHQVSNLVGLSLLRKFRPASRASWAPTSPLPVSIHSDDRHWSHTPSYLH
jgi:hypothetical protein